MDFNAYTIHPNLLKEKLVVKKRNKLSKAVQQIEYPITGLSAIQTQERFLVIINEIDLKSHNEIKAMEDALGVDMYNLKTSIKDQAIQQIERQYKREENKISSTEQFYSVKRRCLSNLTYREIMYRHIEECKDSAASKIDKLFNNPKNISICEKLLEKTILQALLWLFEPYVLLRVLKRDLNLAQTVLQKAQNKASELLSMKIIVILDTTTFLPVDSFAGVCVQNKEGTIVIMNTFKSRVEVAVNTYLPVLKQLLLKGIQKANKNKSVK